ncbi:hypothetical protein EWM64_g6621 [Hericium alpestre]|uniref:FAD-binding domain-containing protein n=1 Tax=Hericium alpestre TaxID=135208 RepID=A0A4Y9ZU77_9AGAM|nr:hypothetical protein EWM64_g6621 [Hericium alpestre]
MGTSVLIVGSGPTGLVDVLTLAQNGVDVRIIEKLPYFPIGQRGAGIMPRSLEVYRYLGILDDVKKAGIPFLEWLHYEGGKPVTQFPVMPFEDPTPIYPETSARCILWIIKYLYREKNNPWLLGQDAACRILRDHLKKLGVEVELSTDLLNLEQGADSVMATNAKVGAEEKITARYVVGADGAKGIVRKLLNLTFLGETRDTVHMIIGDTAVTGLDDKADRTATDNVYFTMLYGADLDYQRALEDHDYLRAFAYRVARMPALNIGEIKTIADHRPNMRVVNTFQQGRVFVAGDAAHVQSATGGQGMNSAIMDAFNLAWKLALAVKGLTAPGLLDSYTTECLPVITEMQRLTTALLNKAFGAASPWHRPRVLTQLGVHYRWSSVVVDLVEPRGEVREDPLVCLFGCLGIGFGGGEKERGREEGCA